MSQARSRTLIFILCVVVKWGDLHVYGLDAEDFYNSIEDSVKSIASSVRDNYKNRQELWETCSEDGRCSVYSYKPLQLYSNNSECLAMADFSRKRICPATIGSTSICKKVTLATESYIRIPSGMNETTLSCDAQQTICAQKDLDTDAFAKVYANDSGLFNKIAWTFFGAYNGVFRIYPGLEQPPKTCDDKKYDPRKRPWYKAVTGVSKQVVVLLDTGGPMSDALSVPVNRPVITAAQYIVIEFLDTLIQGDAVSVYTFDNIGAEISGKVEIRSSNDTENQAALEPLKKSIANISVSASAAEANLTAALETVMNGEFEIDPKKAPSLKIRIVITGGKLADGDTLPFTSPVIETSKTKKVRTFIYHLSENTSPGTNSSEYGDQLYSLACTLEGSYNKIPRTNILKDPLSALRSFYSYVALIRFNVDDGNPLWVTAFEAFSFVGPVMAVIYPVFDGENLLGVAAIELKKDEIEKTWPGTIDNRNAADIKHNEGAPLDCTIKLTPDDSNCSDRLSLARGLCLNSSFEFANSKEQDYINRVCCDGRNPAEHPNQNVSGGGVKKGGIIGGAIGASAIVVIIILCIRYWSTRGLTKDHASSEEHSPPPHPITLATPPPGKYEGFNALIDIKLK